MKRAKQSKKCAEEMVREEILELKMIEDVHSTCPALVSIVVHKFVKMLQEKENEINRLSKILDKALKITSSGDDSDDFLSQG